MFLRFKLHLRSKFGWSFVISILKIPTKPLPSICTYWTFLCREGEDGGLIRSYGGMSFLFVHAKDDNISFVIERRSLARPSTWTPLTKIQRKPSKGKNYCSVFGSSNVHFHGSISMLGNFSWRSIWLFQRNLTIPVRLGVNVFFFFQRHCWIQTISTT